MNKKELKDKSLKSQPIEELIVIEGSENDSPYLSKEEEVDFKTKENIIKKYPLEKQNTLIMKALAETQVAIGKLAKEAKVTDLGVDMNVIKDAVKMKTTIEKEIEKGKIKKEEINK